MSSGSSTRENSPSRYERYLQDTSGALGQDCDKELHIEQWLQQLRGPKISPKDLTKDLTEADIDKLDNDMCAAGDPDSCASSTSKSSEVRSLDSEAGMLNLSPATSFNLSHPGTGLAESLADTEPFPSYSAGSGGSITEL
ncbi:hypothetical protein OOU_Y34scaffold01167g6 [Pyricularia oryzae Y34]|uniref:Uncharacterized protein n=2 Tax=Pyricularia oryzae TaxID=318829 RepID=A0AA97NLL8_PYRO3|nr:hypothetical protein OOU_Y34scaffold01167g6 [Pyricularia oryzae Y34]